jgi:hypothetical protein
MNTLWSLLLPLVETPPAPEDVKQGLLGFVVFISLALAVALLGLSLVRHLRKARTNFEERESPDSGA